LAINCSIFLTAWVRRLYDNNFIRDSKLRDEEFDKCNDDNGYMLDNENDDVMQEMAGPDEDDISGE
jgi:hypothetical protein